MDRIPNKYISFSEASLILNQSRHAPFLTELKEEYDNELHITICCPEMEQDTASHTSCGNADIDAIIAHCKPILPTESNVQALRPSPEP